jgi:hypothetical protein
VKKVFYLERGTYMEENMLNISKEQLEKLSIEELADLKVEVDDLMNKIDNILATCEEALNM